MTRRVCYVVCYKDPNYIRTITLVSALSSLENIELVIVKNNIRNPIRYLEVPLKLIQARIRFKPDIYIVGFRGNEVFWLLYPAMIGKKIVFDEFINLHDWLVNEHHKFKENSRIIKLLDKYMRQVIKKSDFVLEDTDAHVQLSKDVYGTPSKKLMTVPVGADEDTFHPISNQSSVRNFEIFFFGNMLPLHGLDVMLESIRLLCSQSKLNGIHLTLAGGKGDSKMVSKIKKYIKLNKLSSYITYTEWVDYQNLPKYIAESNLCLGGPFGDTGQAKRVVTGKTYQFLAMARPVVVGRIEKMHGFRDKQNCLLIGQGDPKALADAIEWAQKHKAELINIGQNGRKLYENNFSKKVIADKLQTIFEEIA